jgi:coproporphyrinogen III oxidase-like Fe-S oxidoreductase
MIYGLPGLSMEKWNKNLDIAINFLPEHIAAYHLTYEKGTVMDYKRRKEKFRAQNEKISFDQYKMLSDKLQHKGYTHYEISNFALPGYISRHNSAYWKGKKYIGVGPSAHSFNGRSRRWNIARNASYIKYVQAGTIYYESEELDNNTLYHDYVLTSLRTMWGIDLAYIMSAFGKSIKDHCLQNAMPFLRSGRMYKKGDKLFLSREGMFIADHVIESLFLATD